LLAAYAFAFAWRALGGGLLIVDDHPGQLYRLARVGELGPWPWRLDPGWWAGYAELQYYPPGAAYLGAVLQVFSLGAVGADAVYQMLLWVIYVLPGATTYLLLVRVLGSPWLALPGAFLALTLSGGSRSGVEEGLRWGLIAARLGWSLLPLLALSLRPWTERAKPPLTAALILASIILIHPAHAPAAVVLVFLSAAERPGGLRARMASAGLLTLAAGGLTAFWLVPLLAHLEMALPLAWGDSSVGALAAQIVTRPLLLGLGVASALACWLTRRGASPAARDRWLARFAPAVTAVILLDAVVIQPLGVMWLPADRLMDSLLLALILGASRALGEVAPRLQRSPDWSIALAAIAGCALLASPDRSEPTLSLWPRRGPSEWTKEATLVAGARLDDLWTALSNAPPGRILFVRSSVPLAYRRQWWRPHSHITALAPIRSGREIVNGTFTHPSPIAGLVYTGAAVNRPITLLVEQRDGLTLFGRPLEALTRAEFDRLAGPLRISAVVALDEDEGRLPFLDDNPGFARPSRVGPFVIYASREPRAIPVLVAPQRWRFRATDPAGAWTATGFAYSPLWRARAGDQRLAARRDDLGMLEVKLPAGPSTGVVELSHAPGPAEWIGLGVTVLTGLLLVARATRDLARANGRITPAGRS
jgi:hypothetical protein